MVLPQLKPSNQLNSLQTPAGSKVIVPKSSIQSTQRLSTTNPLNEPHHNSSSHQINQESKPNPIQTQSSTSTLSIKVLNPSSSSFHQPNPLDSNHPSSSPNHQTTTSESNQTRTDSNHMLITHPYPTHSTHPSNQPNPHPPVTPSTQTEPQTQVTIPKEDLIEEENPRGEGEEEEGMEGEEGSSSEDRIEIFGSSPVGIIGKTKPRAVVRIERDYSAKGATSGRVQFWDGWVTELEGRITPLQLQNTLNDLNGILASAYDPYKSILDNTLSVLTLYLSPLFFTSHYQKEMIGFSHALELANQKIFNPVGLNLLHPRKVAFLFLEIEYY